MWPCVVKGRGTRSQCGLGVTNGVLLTLWGPRQPSLSSVLLSVATQGLLDGVWGALPTSKWAQSQGQALAPATNHLSDIRKGPWFESMEREK